MSLSTLDTSLFFNGSKAEQNQFVRELMDGFDKHGCVKLRNHGISGQSILNTFEVSHQFFNLPSGVKMSVHHKGGASLARGYSPWSNEKTHKVRSSVEIPDAMDAREQFDMGPPTDHMFPTPWLPNSTIPTLRSTLESFYEELLSTCHGLVTAIELGLHLPADALTVRCRPDSSELRLNHYPSMPVAQLADDTITRRIWPHTDTGIFSILFQDGVGGLMLENRQNAGKWLKAGSEDVTEMVVIVANTLERWTNGLLRAGVHYVAAPWTTSDVAEDEATGGVAPERFSTVMFYRPGAGVSVGPTPEFVSPERPAQFEDMTALDYLKAENSKVFY